MRLFSLTLVLAVCSARAIPVQQKSEDVKPIGDEPIDDVSVERSRGAPDAIPVAVVEEALPARTPDENSNDYVPGDDEPSANIKRLEVDLDNPGPPQRQEHETQNPEFYERDHLIADIKQKLLDTENVFKKSVASVNQGFANWVPNGEHLKAIQNDIKEMQSKFLAQLANLNRSLQNYMSPQSTKAVIVDPESAGNLKEVESRLKVLENNFRAGVETLSEGVKALQAKADGDGNSPAEPGSSNPASPDSNNEQSPNNPLGQIFQFFSNAMGQAISQVQNTFNSITSPNSNDNGSSSDPNAPPTAQADDAALTRPPSLWNNFQSQLSQIFNGGQQTQSSDSSSLNPFNQANQFFQNVLNNFRPFASDSSANSKPESDQPATTKPVESKPPVQPAAQTVAAPVEPAVQPAAAQPAADPVSSAEQPVKQEAAPAKETPASPQRGPIMQIVQNNPLVKGIVQRIQSITNPEKPRVKEPQKASESVKSQVPIKEDVKEDPAPTLKGHGGNYGGNGGPAPAGDNNDSDRLDVEDAPIEEKIEEVPHKCVMEKEADVASDKEEKEIALPPEKTE